MRLNFLCPHHRQSLSDRPELARELWLETASRIAQGPNAPTPLQVNLAGSALEAAGIYLEAAPSVNAELIRQYADSAIQLIEMLGALKQRHLCIVVVSGATAMVEHLARSGAPSHESLFACRRLSVAARSALKDGSPRRAVATANLGTTSGLAVATSTIH